jgi:hypothetical protein
MKRKSKPGKSRNFVAKHAQESGAGRHKDQKSDYQRRPKHRKRDVRAQMEMS